jgi:hypothetical protein
MSLKLREKSNGLLSGPTVGTHLAVYCTMDINDLNYFKIKAVAQGRIKCTWCGNDDWKEFRYYEDKPLWVGGCGLCGILYAYIGGRWLKYLVQFSAVRQSDRTPVRPV